MVTDRHTHRQTDKPTLVKTYSLAFADSTNKWVLNKAGVKRVLLDTVKARKLA